MKKVLIATNRFTGGGVETTLLTLLENYSKTEYDITLALCCKGGELERLIPRCVKVRYLLPFDPMSLPKIVSQIYQFFLLLCPGWLCNFLFIHDHYDAAIAYSGNTIYYLKGFRGKKTCWIHDDWFPFKIQNHIIGRIRKKKTLYMLKECENIICVSENLRNMLYEFSNGTLSHARFMPNPINVGLIREKGGMQCDYVFDSNILYFISVGRLHPIKGYDRLVRIMVRLREKYSNFKLLILGAGAEEENLKAMIDAEKAEGYIELLGFQDNPHKYVDKCDVYVCSSIMEGYSTTVSEALILGKAIVSTNCGGSDQLLDNGKYGILTDNSEEDLERGIRTLIEDKALINKYQQLALERADMLFNLKKAISDIQTIAFVTEGMYRGG